jgi:hypothetical protein
MVIFSPVVGGRSPGPQDLPASVLLVEEVFLPCGDYLGSGMGTIEHVIKKRSAIRAFL